MALFSHTPENLFYDDTLKSDDDGESLRKNEAILCERVRSVSTSLTVFQHHLSIT